MNFESIFDAVSSFHRPRVPVVPEDEANLTVEDSSGDVNVEITVSNSGAIVQNVLTGMLFVDGDTPIVRVSELDDVGQPVPVFRLHALIRQQNSAIMPLPARIRYEFQGDGPDLEARVRDRLQGLLSDVDDVEGYLDSVLMRDANQPGTADVSVEDANEAVDVVMDGGVGVLVPAGWLLWSLEDGDSVVLEFEDYRNYGAVDQPLAVLPAYNVQHPPEEQTKNRVPPDPGRLQAVYRPGECDEDLEPNSDATDILSETVERDGTQEDRIELINHPIFYDYGGTTHVDEFKIKDELGGQGEVTDTVADEEQLVVHYEDGSGNQVKELFELDRYEKWARFDADPRWHFRNWYTSGFLRQQDRETAFVTGAVPEEYPPSRNRVPGSVDVFGGRDLPQVDARDDREEAGEARPTYWYDVQSLKWELPVNDDNTRSYYDDFSDDDLREFSEFRYEGADGMAEYVKRVAAHEYGVQSDETKEGFKAQLIAARSYILNTWLSSRDPTNPFADTDEYTEIDPTPRYHVHKLSLPNQWVRREPDRRLIMEEAIAETRGQVMTHRGRLIFSEYFAGDTSTFGVTLGERNATLDHPQSDSYPYIRGVHSQEGVKEDWVRYTTGTVTLQNGVPGVDGNGTGWTNDINNGDWILIVHDGNARHRLDVQQRLSPIELRLANPYGGQPVNGQDYVLHRQDYRSAVGHGRGFSQIGSRALSGVGHGTGAGTRVSYHQIAHYYYYGIQVRNNYGKGDIITETPDGDDWLVENNPPTPPEEDVEVDDGYWQLDEVIESGDDNDWRVAHDFLASEFCTRVDGQDTELEVNVSVVSALQMVRYQTESGVGVEGHETKEDDDGNLVADPDRVRIDVTEVLEDVRDWVDQFGVSVDIPGGGGTPGNEYDEFVVEVGE